MHDCISIYSSEGDFELILTKDEKGKYELSVNRLLDNTVIFSSRCDHNPSNYIECLKSAYKRYNGHKLLLSRWTPKFNKLLMINAIKYPYVGTMFYPAWGENWIEISIKLDENIDKIVFTTNLKYVFNLIN